MSLIQCKPLRKGMALGMALANSPSIQWKRLRPHCLFPADAKKLRWSARVAYRHVRMARDYADDYGDHLTASAELDAKTAKHVLNEIDRGLNKALKHLAILKRDSLHDQGMIAEILRIMREVALARGQRRHFRFAIDESNCHVARIAEDCSELVSQLDNVLGWLAELIQHGMSAPPREHGS